MARWGSGLVDRTRIDPTRSYLGPAAKRTATEGCAIAAAEYYTREEKGRFDGDTNTYTFGFVGLWSALTRLQ